MRRFLLICLISLASDSIATAQDAAPDDPFDAPLDLPLTYTPAKPEDGWWTG